MCGIDYLEFGGQYWFKFVGCILVWQRIFLKNNFKGLVLQVDYFVLGLELVFKSNVSVSILVSTSTFK